MAADLHASVSKITITQGRIDAEVILGTTRYGVTIDPRKQEPAEVITAVDTLREAVIKVVKTDIAEHLEADLSRSTRRALSP